MTDNELKRVVSAELNRDPAVPSAATGVLVKDGVVTLTRHLDSQGAAMLVWGRGK